MALLFDDASSQFLEKTTAIILTATPLTMACWFFSNDGTIGQNLMDLHNSASTEFINSFLLTATSSGVPSNISARTSAPAGSSAAGSTANWSANVWQHACGVYASATDRRAFLNGGNKGTSATSRVPSGINRMSIGCADSSTRAEFMSGFIADAAIWSVALADAEVALLATGKVPPYLIQRANLIGYWPLCGYLVPEINLATGALDMTLNNGPTKDSNPAILGNRCIGDMMSQGAGAF